MYKKLLTIYVTIWYNSEMLYLVNYGWGSYDNGRGLRKWICVSAQIDSSVPDTSNYGNLYMIIN